MKTQGSHFVQRLLGVVAWVLLSLLMIIPFAEAAMSPLQQGRSLTYIIGGLAGVLALACLLIQPLLGVGWLRGLHRHQQTRWHRRIGTLMVCAVGFHIGGLYLTSPDDMADALLLVAPTPFSIYGVIGLWSIVLTTIFVVLRTRMNMGSLQWNVIHNALALIVVVSSVVHSLMIDGAMGELSKFVLCMAVLAATGASLLYVRVLKPLARSSE